MKRIFTLLFVLTVALSFTGSLSAQLNRGEVRISATKQTNRDSLARRFTRSPFTPGTATSNNGDTVTVVGQVIWSPSTSFANTNGRILLHLQDTARGANGEFLPYSALTLSDAVGAGATLDSTLANLDTGFVVKVTLQTRHAFGAGFQGSYVASTEFDKINALSYEIIDQRPMPAPVVVPAESLFHPQTITDVRFNPNGTAQPAGAVNYMNGDQYDGMLVTIPGPFVLEATSRVLASNGRYPTFYFRKGNIRIPFGDNSKFLRGVNTSFTNNPGGVLTINDSIPANGSIVESITGVVGKVRLDGIPDDGYLGRTSLGVAYRIHLRTRDDIKLSTEALPPVVNRIERPLAAPIGQPTAFSIITRDQNQGGAVNSVKLFFNTTLDPNSNFFGPYDSTSATQSNDSTWAVNLPALLSNQYANYFVKVTNTAGKVAVFPDTTLPFRPIIRGAASGNISDIQYTPYTDKRSPLLGSTVTITGTVTSDSADAVYGNYRSYFIQDSNSDLGWGGIQVIVNNTISGVTRGTVLNVTGTVVEADLTGGAEDLNLRNADATTSIDARGGSVTVNAQATPLSVVPVVALPNLSANTSEALESMLVRFNNVYVIANNNGFGEFTLSQDSLGTLQGYRVDDLSGHEYKGTGTGRNPSAVTVLNGDFFTSVTGVNYFARSTFRLLPRKSGDFTGYRSGGTSNVREPGVIPTRFDLAQNFPNPFNPTTSIRYQLASPSDVRLEVFDLLGRRVATLANTRQVAGSYTVNFNAAQLSSGVYFYRLQAGTNIFTKKMLLVK